MWPLSLSQNTMISNSYHRGDRTRNGRLHGVGVTRQSTQWGRTWPVATRHPNPHHGSHHTVNFRQPNTEIPEIYIDGNSSVQPLNNHSLPNSSFSQPHPRSSTSHPSAPRMPNSTNAHSDPQAHRAPPTPFVMHHGTYDAAFDPFVTPRPNQPVDSYEYALHAATGRSRRSPPPIRPNQRYANSSPNQQYYTPNRPITASDPR